VAGNLNIVSDQDTERMSASLNSWSLNGAIGLYGSPSSISGSYAKGDAHGDYASVTTTSGLFAGGGGYAVTVSGTTTCCARQHGGQQFQDFIEQIVSNPALERRYAVDGTVYYLDEATHTIVIRGQRGEATAFRPDCNIGWRNYLETQVPKNISPPGFDPAAVRRY
jgi:hypothetical protein